MSCSSCGNEIKSGTTVCVNGGEVVPVGGKREGRVNREWLIAMLLALFLGPFGAHNFYLKRYSIALAQLILGICSYLVISVIWGIVDWIVILSGNYRRADGTILKRRN